MGKFGLYRKTRNRLIATYGIYYPSFVMFVEQRVLRLTIVIKH